MPDAVSMSTNFAGPAGALIMSLIAFSIVFLVIIGLMFIMMLCSRLSDMVDSKVEVKH